MLFCSVLFSNLSFISLTVGVSSHPKLVSSVPPVNLILKHWPQLQLSFPFLLTALRLSAKE